MKRGSHLAGFAVLIALGAAPAWGARLASVSGVVRDSAGVPQIGAEVELLRPDLSVAASAYTDSQGQFSIAQVLPGRYALKAMAMSFLPALRENVRVRRATVVNLTLNTLYEVMQWFPAQPRTPNEQKDDWMWTLRSAADRPLLRWLENGPLVVVSDGSSARPKVMARLMATGRAGTFGESGQWITAAVQSTPANSRELLARVDFAPGSNQGMESMLGFRQDLGFVGSVQSVAAVSLHPQIVNAGGSGLDEAAMRTSETMSFGPALQANVGATEAWGRLMGASPSTVAEGLPFASIQWQDGDSTVSYRMDTMVEGPEAWDGAQAAAMLPEFSARAGQLVLEHGLHQEIGWERHSHASGMAVFVYTDDIQNPVLEAGGHFVPGDPGAAPMNAGMIFDPASGLLRAAGPDFSTTGVEASFERRLPDGNQVRLSYASGDALVMPALPQFTGPAQILAAAHPRYVQTYALDLSGVLSGTKTQWCATYRWQPDDAVTAVAPFAVNDIDPFLTMSFAQPIHINRDGSGGIEVLLEVRNLLAEGYRPYILSDGSLLLFAADQRSFGGGLGFTF